MRRHPKSVLVTRLSVLFVCASACGRVGYRAQSGDVDGAVPSTDAALDAAPLDAASDASPLDALGLDSAPPDAAPLDPTACDDVLAGVIFCDGYETALSPPWDISSPSATRETAPTYRGVGALRAAVGGPMESAATFTTDVGSWGDGDEVFLRAYLHFPSSATLGWLQLMIVRAQPNQPDDQVGVIAIDGNLGYVSGPGGTQRDTGRALPREAWVCVEAQIALATGATGSVSSWIDGVAAGPFTAIPTTTAAGVGALAVGIPWARAAQTGSAEVYVDEVVFDTARIGCDR